MNQLTPGLLIQTPRERRRTRHAQPAPTMLALLLEKLESIQASPSLPADKADELAAVIAWLRETPVQGG